MNITDLKIKLSVIVPVFNTEKYLEKCVKSIINQTYSNLEIILIDDGSSDDSGLICDRLALEDERIVVIHKDNGGQLSARKMGVLASNGDYIVSVDSDDWIEATRFEYIVRRGLCNNPDMVYIDGFVKEYKDRTELDVYFPENEYLELDKAGIHSQFCGLLVGSSFFMDRRITLSHLKACVKREVYLKNIMQINNDIRRTEDAITILSCILDSNFLVVITDLGYHYIQQRPGSINMRTTNWEKDHAFKYYKQLELLRNDHLEVLTLESERVITQFAYYNLFLTNYKSLYDFYDDYLFPYREACNGSKLIIYGAGNIGVEIINALDSDNRFVVAAWVDQLLISNPRSEHVIEKPTVIFEHEFDYLIIAILVTQTAKRIREELIEKGVPQNKILIMKSDEMRPETLHGIFEHSDNCMNVMSAF